MQDRQQRAAVQICSEAFLPSGEVKWRGMAWPPCLDQAAATSRVGSP